MLGKMKSESQAKGEIGVAAQTRKRKNKKEKSILKGPKNYLPYRISVDNFRHNIHGFLCLWHRRMERV